MTGDEQIINDAKLYIDNRDNIRYLSMASLWELSIKYSSGKLLLMEPYEILIPRLLQINDIHILNISIEHMSEVAKFAFS